uniref:Uncharacterized protein n=1 Tax=Anguilla anguilla TaxID=7936 RepID=A0A0E9VIF2_ANGAN
MTDSKENADNQQNILQHKKSRS